MTSRLVVLGGGAAGMSAASAARRVDPELEIIVLEATGYAAYGMCGLPYYLAGLVEAPEDLLAYPPAYFRDHRGLDLRHHAEAIELDLDQRVVHYRHRGRTDRVGFSALVVTTGGAPIRPELPQLAGRRVFTVRTLEDAIELRGQLDSGQLDSGQLDAGQLDAGQLDAGQLDGRPGGRALVIGAGYIGLETAEALHARGCAVTVVDKLDRVLPNVDSSIAAIVEEHVRERVELRLGVDAAELLTDPALSAGIIVLCVGVRPASTIAAAAGARTGPGGALLVDERMCTSLPGVWAAGDCIAPWHRVLGRPAFVPLGPAANKTGRVAGTVAAGGEASFAGIVGTAVVKVFDLEVARTGLTLAEAQAAGLRATATDVVSRSRAKYYPGVAPLHVRLVHEAGGRLLGAQLVGREGAAKRVDVVAAALYAGLAVSDLAAFDLSYAPPYAPVYDPLIVAAQRAQQNLAVAV